jgi:membrane protease YdiL (CAAX protease family)
MILAAFFERAWSGERLKDYLDRRKLTSVSRDRKIEKMTTDTLSQQAFKDPVDRARASRNEKQYSLPQILWVSALASIPGGLLFWLGLPLLDTYTEISTVYLTLIVLVIPYLWHCLLTFLILKREGGDLDWNTVKDRLWLRTTTDPRTGRRNNVLWLWAIPVIAVYALTAASPIFQSINNGWARNLRIREPAQYSFDVLFENPGALVGDWGFFLAILLVSLLTVSEEVIFRGVLLPKMKSVFGRGDWIVNGFLFAFYHLDKPWKWPGLFMCAMLTLALPARVFRSTCFSTAVRLSQAFYFLFLTLGLVLGLA